MLPVSLVLCTMYLQIDIKDRHGTNIQSITLEIYVSLRFPSSLLALWLETFLTLNVCFFSWELQVKLQGAIECEAVL